MKHMMRIMLALLCLVGITNILQARRALPQPRTQYGAVVVYFAVDAYDVYRVHWRLHGINAETGKSYSSEWHDSRAGLSNFQPLYKKLPIRSLELELFDNNGNKIKSAAFPIPSVIDQDLIFVVNYDEIRACFESANSGVEKCTTRNYDFETGWNIDNVGWIKTNPL